jgi:hypothetical protein
MMSTIRFIWAVLCGTVMAGFLPGICQADPVPQSIPGDSTASSQEWNEYYHSPTDLFQPGNSYQITFTYLSKALASNADFYLLVRDTNVAGSTYAWQDWRANPNSSGTIQATFVDKNAGNYQLIYGIHFQGAVIIKDTKIVSTPIILPPKIHLPSPVRTWVSPGNTTYYVSSVSGSDTHDGLSAAHPWESLSKVNSGTFAAGDKILLQSGSRWTGFLAPAGSGSPDAPILIDRYGAGPKPAIDAQSKWLATLYEHNESYITVRNLNIANQGTIPEPTLSGVAVNETDFGTASGIVLDSLDIHDVTGSDVKDDGGGAGINLSCTTSKTLTHFDGLTVENCHLTHTDRNGITMEGPWERTYWYPNLHVVIKNNLLEDIGGDGIVPIACDGAIVESNVIHGCRMRAQDYAAGIWPWSCDNTIIQYNEVSGMKGTNDGEGFDSDWNCRNSLFQYNFSHNNDGGFMLICNDAGQSSTISAGNTGTVIRYNVSIDDGLHTFNIGGPVMSAHIYNNTIYIGRGAADHLVDSNNWGGVQTGTIFENNVFIADQSVGFQESGSQAFTFNNNLYFGGLQGYPADSKAILTNPRLQTPGSPKPSDYRPRPGSPCFQAGEIIPDNGGQDFLGNPVPENTPPTIGAFQK